MDQLTSLNVLLWSTLTIGFVHALAPDHWIPFVSVGKAQGWSVTRLIVVTTLAGLGHVGSSIAIGLVGLAAGFGLTGLESIESQRGEVAGLLLIGFGLAYAVWGLKQVRKHHHAEMDPKKVVTFWALITIFVLGPCEPLIPLMFVSAAHGWEAVFMVSGLFGVVTLIMMVVQSYLVFVGVDFFKWAHVNHRYTHVTAGLVIAFTGLTVMFLGI